MSSRVRMAAEPALIVLAVFGVVSMATGFRKRDGRALAAALLMIGIVGILVRLPVGGPGAAPFHRILAEAYAGQGATTAAAEHRTEADRLSDPEGRRLGQSP
ncbi:MAG: hypothetical protein FD129_3370 [bacterium]|nr:MAG: hypothetical protein FD129_3370 [bacterium]